MSRATRAARRAENRRGIAAMLARSPHPWRSRLAWRLMGWATRLDPRIHTLVVGTDGSPLPERAGEIISHGFGIIAQGLITARAAEEYAARETAAALARARAGAGTEPE